MIRKKIATYNRKRFAFFPKKFERKAKSGNKDYCNTCDAPRGKAVVTVTKQAVPCGVHHVGGPCIVFGIRDLGFGKDELRFTILA